MVVGVAGGFVVAGSASATVVGGAATVVTLLTVVGAPPGAAVEEGAPRETVVGVAAPAPPPLDFAAVVGVGLTTLRFGGASLPFTLPPESLLKDVPRHFPGCVGAGPMTPATAAANCARPSSVR